MKKYTLTIFTLSLFYSFIMQAQEITFENDDFRSLTTYDCWVNGPFRQDLIKGEADIVANPFKDETNVSDKVVALKRSRFGSNQFGARIDLKETFTLDTFYKYVHVMIHKPHAGRSMLVGLGRHIDWAEQNPDVEQFWELSCTENRVGEWYDAVFPIKGNGGIDIYSLVVVPDCESPHALTDDFYCYIDDIVVNDRMESRTPQVVDRAKSGKRTDSPSNAHPDKVTVSNNDLNGDITLTDGTPLKGYKQPYGKGFTVKINPYEGFLCESVRIRHGYNLDGEQVLNGKLQWKQETLTPDQFKSGTFEIPASWVDGNISVEGIFNKVLY